MCLRFLTGIYGDGFAPYLHVLLNSIDEVYGSDAKVYIYHDNLCDETIKEINRKSPQAIMRHFPMRVERKYQYGSILAKWQLIAHERQFLTKGVNDLSDGPLVILNSDMLFLRKIDKFLPEDNDFDIAFTYKTEKDEALKWPINCGLMIIDNSVRVRKFFNYWQEVTDDILINGLALGDEYWGGIQQASFGRIIQERNNQSYREGFTRHDCKLAGIPCKYLNETRRTQNLSDSYVLHYKSLWRHCLPQCEYSEYVTPQNASTMMELWQGHLERWNAR